MRRLLRRMWGAARLDADTFEEVEADPSSIAQALIVVALAAGAIGLATWLGGIRVGVPEARLAFQVTVAVLLPALVWVGGSAFAFMVGASFLRGHRTEADFPEVLRTTGFAFAPGLLLAVAATPPDTLGIVLGWSVRLWVLVAAVVAIRQALDFTTLRAVGTFGSAAGLLWLLLWGLAAAPRPF